MWAVLAYMYGVLGGVWVVLACVWGVWEGVCKSETAKQHTQASTAAARAPHGPALHTVLMRRRPPALPGIGVLQRVARVERARHVLLPFLALLQVPLHLRCSAVAQLRGRQGQDKGFRARALVPGQAA